MKTGAQVLEKIQKEGANKQKSVADKVIQTLDELTEFMYENSKQRSEIPIIGGVDLKKAVFLPEVQEWLKNNEYQLAFEEFSICIVAHKN